jgi:hypothetical protein
MPFIIIFVTVTAIVLSYVYARLFFKRLSLRRRLLKVCKRKGFTLTPTHKRWWLGGKKGKNCDLHIETGKEIISVKLFETLRRSTLLYFCPESEFYAVICIMNLVAPRGGSVPITHTTRQKKLPDYDYGYMLPDSGKKQKKILLINPVCGEYHNFTKKEHTGNNVADIGDLIWGSELNSLSPLIRYLEGCQ